MFTRITARAVTLPNLFCQYRGELHITQFKALAVMFTAQFNDDNGKSTFKINRSL